MFLQQLHTGAGKLKLSFLLITFSLLVSSGFLYASGGKERPKIGLVLSGGGSKGFAHIGTLKIIDSLQIPIDYIAGTSMGGIIGALYSIGYSPDEIEKLARSSDWTEIFTDTPPRYMLPHFRKKISGKYQLEFGIRDFTPVIPSSLIHGQKIMLMLSQMVATHCQTTNFDSLPIPLRLVSTDLVSGREIVMSGGSLPKALRSSMSIPTVFSPVEWGDYLLIDGGVLNNFPVDVAKKMGATFIIGVNVGTPPKDVKKLDNILDIIDQTTSIPGFVKEEAQEKQTDLLIKPNINDYTAADFDMQSIDEIISIGIASARNNVAKFLKLKEMIDSIDAPLYASKYIERVDQSFIREFRVYHKPAVYSVTVEGNESLPFEFIYNLLGVKPGDLFDTELLEHRITDMYSLGYFETINYEIMPEGRDRVILILKVKERPLRKLLVGVRYDDQYKLVGILGLQSTNLLFPGLRTEIELQFAGLTRLKLMAAYPTRSLDFPVYPYFRFNYKNVPVDIFDNTGEKFASYADNSSQVALGLGISFQKFWVLEADYNYEFMNIVPTIADRTNPESYFSWKDRIRKIQASLDLDLLDDMVMPRDGILIQANAEKAIMDLGSDVDYWKASFSLDIYHTLFQRHTTRLMGSYCQSKNIPIYKAFLFGGPENFIGYDYNQLLVNNLLFARFDYRYEYKKDIFLKLIANAGYNYEVNAALKQENKRLLWGYGAGIEFLSPLGPLQVIFSWGEKDPSEPGNFKSSIYFTAGYKF